METESTNHEATEIGTVTETTVTIQNGRAKELMMDTTIETVTRKPSTKI